mgnify:CR=1 FL=1
MGITRQTLISFSYNNKKVRFSDVQENYTGEYQRLDPETYTGNYEFDVLENYMSFKRYYKLIKRSDIEDKEYEKKKTVRVLGNYVDLQDHAIEKKAD